MLQRQHITAAACAGGLVLALAGIVQPAWASELVYTPVNPNFGGSPLNGATLLSQAQAQNKAKDPDSDQQNKQSALDQFNDSLQRAVLGRLASALTASIIGPNGQLVPGTVETGDFMISIVDLGGGTLQVTTTDKVTGASTSFEVGGH
jgi:curli production assembly/transport component CsgF